MIDEEKIRQRAYELWEQEGQPEGAEQDHWRLAREELEAEQLSAEANILGTESGSESQSDAESDAESESESESDVLPTDLP